MGKRVSIGLGGIDAIKTQLDNITRSIALLKEFIETYELQAAEDPDDEKAPPMSKGDVTLTREEAKRLLDLISWAKSEAEDDMDAPLAAIKSKLSAAQGQQCEHEWFRMRAENESLDKPWHCPKCGKVKP